MTDPYTSSRVPVADPGQTSLGLHGLFDASHGAPAAAWHCDWNRYAAWLFSVCLKRRVEQGDAQDVVQEVLSALPDFRRFRRNHPGAPLRPWMVRVLMNKIADLHRDRARRPEAIPSEHLDAVPEARQLDLDFAPGEDADHTLYGPILDRVERRCAEPNNWRAFHGVVLEGKATAEVAAELGMNVAQVHTARSRVLRRLREEIGAQAAHLQHEFEEPTWSLFLEVAVEGKPPGVVAGHRGMEELEVDRAVSRVLRRLTKSLRMRSR